MNAKEQKIKEAWGVHYAYDIDENGFRKYSEFDKFHLHQWGDYYFEKSYNEITKEWCVRPKSLSGIENNNGWTKIESESDLPKEKELCHFIPCNSFEEQFIGFIDKTMNEVFFVDKYYTSFYNEFNKPILKLNSYIPSQITHYQPVIKPQPPIY